eukprot:15433364-Alexandrium_andersonii.AAC.1
MSPVLLLVHGLASCVKPRCAREAAHKKTEREFVRKRRAAVSEAVSASSHVPASAGRLSAMCVDSFGNNEGLMKEASFLADKCKLRKVEAISLGAVGGADVGVGEAQLAAATAQHQRVLDARRVAAEKRVANRVERAPDINLQGMAYFVDPQVQLSDATLRVV